MIDAPALVTVFVPREVRDQAERLRRGTGVEPVLTQPEAHRWRVTVANDRIRMWVEFRLVGRPRGGAVCRWAASELWIDGVQQEELARDEDHFLRLFADPDGEVEQRTPEPPRIDIPLESVTPDGAPKIVRMLFDAVAPKLSADQGTVECGRVGRWYWAVQAANDRATVRVLFREYASGSVKRVRSQPVQLMLDGVDKTAETYGRVDRALAMMANPGEPATPSPPVRGEAQAAVNDSVRVRRQSVIRT